MTYDVKYLKNHTCRPPGRFWRWLDNVGVGSVWRCQVCGQRWVLSAKGPYPADWRKYV